MSVATCAAAIITDHATVIPIAASTATTIAGAPAAASSSWRAPPANAEAKGAGRIAVSALNAAGHATRVAASALNAAGHATEIALDVRC